MGILWWVPQLCSWNVVVCSTFIPMYAFIHSISHTKDNLIKWKTIGLHSIYRCRNTASWVGNMKNRRSRCLLLWPLKITLGLDPFVIATMLSSVKTWFSRLRELNQCGLIRGILIVFFFFYNSTSKNKIISISSNMGNTFYFPKWYQVLFFKLVHHFLDFLLTQVFE